MQEYGWWTEWEDREIPEDEWPIVDYRLYDEQPRLLLSS
jgi:hypothetical protein